MQMEDEYWKNVYSYHTQLCDKQAHKLQSLGFKPVHTAKFKYFFIQSTFNITYHF